MVRTLRVYKEPEYLPATRAFIGRCMYCRGEVKLRRDANDEPTLDGRCQRCGQRFYLKLPDEAAWRAEQTQQARALAALYEYAHDPK